MQTILHLPTHIAMFGQVHQPKGFWHTGRQLSVHLLILLTEGELTMRIGEDKVTAAVGEVLFIPANTFYRPLTSPGCTYYFFHFTAETGQASPDEAPTASAAILELGFRYEFDRDDIEPWLPLPNKAHDSPAVEQLIHRLDALGFLRGTREHLLLNNYLQELLIHLSHPVEAEHLPLALRKMTCYVKEHYGEPLSLATLADHSGLSRAYIARLFSRHLHQSAGEYITAIRIAAACELLNSTDKSISLIAEQTGFSEPYYFSRVFKAVTGQNPTTFRRKTRLL